MSRTTCNRDLRCLGQEAQTRKLDTGLLSRAAVEDILPGHVISFPVNLRHAILPPLFADSRICHVCFLSSLAFACVVWLKLRKTGSDEAKSFLFPQRIRSHPSARLDAVSATSRGRTPSGCDGFGITCGLLVALTAKWLDHLPDMVWLLDAPVFMFMFLFNFMGDDPRGSHVRLRCPVAGRHVSPAHHHVHQSCHPDHLDKNFGFILPFRDVLFGTCVMPEDNRDTRFGVTGKDRGAGPNGCQRLWSCPSAMRGMC
ncbi:MAG: sterol desaturase family protein [Tabrizicola sp.]